MTTDPKALAEQIEDRLKREPEREGAFPCLSYSHAEWRVIAVALRAPSSAETMREAAARVADVEGKHGEGWDGPEMARTIAATIRALPLPPPPAEPSRDAQEGEQG